MLFLLIPIAWLTIATVFVAICRMAASADARPLQREASPAHFNAEAIYRPRRPTTCGTVRRRILTSVQSDQLATYR